MKDFDKVLLIGALVFCFYLGQQVERYTGWINEARTKSDQTVQSLQRVASAADQAIADLSKKIEAKEPSAEKNKK